MRISTPLGSGTGFLVSNNQNNALCAVATAGHVVEHAHAWDEPIRINHSESGKSLTIRRQKRAVFLDPARDTAAVLFNRGDLPFPQEPHRLAPEAKYLKVGSRIGWLGFPAIPTASLCFFSGAVSAWLQEQNAYLVDGVAINGVSGGPAFHVLPTDDAPLVTVIGVVSAYVPNRATGEVLPGLSVVRDVSQFHELAPTFASLDQARDAEPQADTPTSASSDDPGKTQTK